LWSSTRVSATARDVPQFASPANTEAVRSVVAAVDPVSQVSPDNPVVQVTPALQAPLDSPDKATYSHANSSLSHRADLAPEDNPETPDHPDLLDNPVHLDSPDKAVETLNLVSLEPLDSPDNPDSLDNPEGTDSPDNLEAIKPKDQHPRDQQEMPEPPDSLDNPDSLDSPEEPDSPDLRDPQEDPVNPEMTDNPEETDNPDRPAVWESGESAPSTVPSTVESSSKTEADDNRRIFEHFQSKNFFTAIICHSIINSLIAFRKTKI